MNEIIDAGVPVAVRREAQTYIVQVGPFDDAAQAERYQFLLIAADQHVPLLVRDTGLGNNEKIP